ncbi:scarecrow-like protein 14 [Carex rostrata]
MEKIYEGLSPLMPSPNSFSSMCFSPDANPLSSIGFCQSPDLLSSTDADLTRNADCGDKFLDLDLTYINQLLMEEGTSDDGENYPDQHPAFIAAQKPFLEIIETSPINQPLLNSNGFTNCDVMDQTSSIEFHSQFPDSANIFALAEDAREDNESFAADPGRGENRVISMGQKKHRWSGDGTDPQEARCAKHSSTCTEEEVRDLFDKVLLCTGNNNCDFNVPPPGAVVALELPPGNKRGRKKGQRKQEEVVDLETLLIQCAQAVATDDSRAANECLKQIRKHSSPYGNSGQRLAHYFAEGLQARLSGMGDEIYSSLAGSHSFTCDLLKAYQLYLTSCPFKKISHFFSTEVILEAARGSKKLHVVDYGIYYGFQWPCFMQRLARMPGGPPRLRITGIDLPQPGFRPGKRIEETGIRLSEYAKIFNIPFEYHAIVAKWETVQVADLNIDGEEVLVVNCLYRLRNIADETVSLDNPRTRVLNTIHKMNPAVFIHGVLNGSFGVPFFETRFREALFHYSTLFDMLETTTSRINEHRLLIERDMFGREVINVISCEGSKRVERPETYKQWQVKNLRAGFKQLPLKEEVVSKAGYEVKKCFDKYFFVDRENGWLLQGWKGRVVFALSAWKPNL